MLPIFSSKNAFSAYSNANDECCNATLNADECSAAHVYLSKRTRMRYLIKMRQSQNDITTNFFRNCHIGDFPNKPCQTSHCTAGSNEIFCCSLTNKTV